MLTPEFLGSGRERVGKDSTRALELWGYPLAINHQAKSPEYKRHTARDRGRLAIVASPQPWPARYRVNSTAFTHGQGEWAR